jgi:DNA-binding transcriptional regulator YiaG
MLEITGVRRPSGTFGEDREFIKACRRQLGLRQRVMAALCGRSFSVWRDYEQGRCRVPQVVRLRLLELLQWKRTGVAPEWATPFEPRE